MLTLHGTRVDGAGPDTLSGAIDSSDTSFASGRGSDNDDDDSINARSESESQRLRRREFQGWAPDPPPPAFHPRHFAPESPRLGSGAWSAAEPARTSPGPSGCH